MIGFAAHGNNTRVDDLTVRADRNNNLGSDGYEVTEHQDAFTLDSGTGVISQKPVYDSSGNLKYDGVLRYKYDPWNRLTAVTKGYLNGSGTLTSGSTVATMKYDAVGRRIEKAVTASAADLACTYHYYYDGNQVIETRNGSNQVLKQQVWGPTYVDELVQIGVNQDPNDEAEQQCERFFWACRDANYNIIGLIDSRGALTERYEYTPYGQRTVFSRGWLAADITGDGYVNLDDYNLYSTEFNSSNPASVADMNGDGGVNLDDFNILATYYGTSLAVADARAMNPTYQSARVTYATVPSGVPLCEFGHQGLMHDEETGLVFNRARVLHPQMGRFMQRDPLGYVDGLSLYEYGWSNPARFTDPTGQIIETIWDVGNVIYDAGRAVKNVAELAYEGGRLGVHWARDDQAGMASARAGLKQDASELGESLVDATADALATATPVVPAGGTKVARAIGRRAAAAAEKCEDGGKFAAKAAENLRKLGLENVELANKSYNHGRKALEEAGFKHLGTTKTGRQQFEHPKTKAKVYFDPNDANRKPHWHIEDGGGNRFDRGGRPVDHGDGSAHIPASG